MPAHHKPTLIQKLSRPRNFLDLTLGVVASCLVVGVLGFTLLSGTYQQSQDIRQQAAMLPTLCNQLEIHDNEDCAALELLYAATGGPGWQYPTGDKPWFSSPVVCDWSGIKCSGQRVSVIDLTQHGLKGSLPNTLSLLPQLQEFIVSNNALLTGALPADIGKITGLTKLDVSNTTLSGPLPLGLTNLANMQYFFFANTSLCIPDSLAMQRWLDRIPHVTSTGLTCTNVTATPTATSTPAPNSTQTPTPTASIQSCNQTCSSNADCQNNLRCYSVDGTQKCRLASNPGSTTCQSTTTGLNYSCNTYCSDTSECAAGLTCWYNQCRLPQNVESSSCSTPSATTLTSMAASCNQACSSNRECAVNLRCYQGRCRLATSPNTNNCTYVPSTAGAAPVSSGTKGGVGMPTATSSAKLSPTPEATSAASLTPTISDSSTAALTPVPNPTPEASHSGILGAFKAWLLDLFAPESANTRRMLFAVLAVGVGIIGIAFLLSSLRKPKTHANKKSPAPSASGSTTSTAHAAAAPTTSQTTVSPPKPPAASSPAPKQSASNSSAPPTGITSAPLYPSGGMVSKLKKKGVTPPK